MGGPPDGAGGRRGGPPRRPQRGAARRRPRAVGPDGRRREALPALRDEFHDSDDEYNDYNFDTLDLCAADGGGAAPPPPPPPPAVIEAFRDRFWVGGRGAWLAAVDEDCNAQLVNLYTGGRVDLPAVSTIPGVEPAGYHCKVRHHATPHCSYTYTFRKIVVRDTPPAASGAGDYLAVAIVTSLILAVARGGHRSWTALKNHRDLMAGYDDAIVHGGRGFAVDGLRLGPAARRRLAPGPGALAGGAGATSYGESVYQWNLAESADGRRLVLACTHGRYAWHEKRGRDGSTKTVHRFHGDGVRLHELDVDDDAAGGDGRRRWRPVTSLGGRALFLGANWPLWAAVTVSRGPPGQVARPNCVYVAPAVLFGYQDEDFDVVVHDLDDGSCRQIKVSDRDEDEDGFVIPIWFTPTLQMWSRRAS
ncbi:hypothetical protein PVAP13_4KG090500 [Panicum virgatum]|uniref:KIB1-4 beta-propeller domain-containing protein n=1 Tax=Panicum virgatum TaxID=38727 RepID=A0A8T0TLR4_PANVG|nr:hypothetical protein PVAP13_4KG090500 [Panicum virgatum]